MLYEVITKNYISIINSNSESLLYLIEDILDFSMIESNQLKINKQQLILNSILNEVYSSFSLRNTNSKVEIKLINNLDIINTSIYSDAYRIKQILTNLIGNALKFTKEGFVEIGAQKIDNYIELYVKDSGPGSYNFV